MFFSYIMHFLISVQSEWQQYKTQTNFNYTNQQYMQMNAKPSQSVLFCEYGKRNCTIKTPLLFFKS